MSADLLREAAASMREHALAAPDQPPTDADITGVWLHSRFHLTTRPAVSLAVADWLDEEAEYMDTTPAHKHNLPSTVSALAVAHAYLRRE